MHERRGERRPPARAVAVAVAVVLAGAVGTTTVGAAGAGAQTSSDSVASLRAKADAIAVRYFDALDRSRRLDLEITRDQRVITDLSARAEHVRAVARARALIAYETSTSRIAALLGGANALETARRARLIDHVNARDLDTYQKLRSITRELRQRRTALDAERTARATALAALRSEGDAMNAQLAKAEAAETAVASATTAVAKAATPDPTTTTTTTTVAPAAASTTTTPTSTTTPSQAAPSPPPNYVGTPGTNPHHDDPFLTCVRQRESGGNYTAVNSAGPYLGAYQFLQATWNGAANHAGLTALIGVPANAATPYDQDAVAWALYQWQGMGPWGGSCP